MRLQTYAAQSFGKKMRKKTFAAKHFGRKICLKRFEAQSFGQKNVFANICSRKIWPNIAVISIRKRLQRNVSAENLEDHELQTFSARSFGQKMRSQTFAAQSFGQKKCIRKCLQPEISAENRGSSFRKRLQQKISAEKFV